MIVGAAAATSAPTLYARPKPVKRAYVRNTRAQRAGITAAVDIKTEKQSRNRGEKLVGSDVDADRTRRNRRVEQRTRGRLQLVKSRSPGRRTQDRPSAEPGQPTRGGDEHCISLHPDCHCFAGRCAPDRAVAAPAQASISPWKAAVIRSGVVETVSIERAEAEAGLVAISRACRRPRWRALPSALAAMPRGYDARQPARAYRRRSPSPSFLYKSEQCSI
jgi:hypothetical protein